MRFITKKDNLSYLVFEDLLKQILLRIHRIVLSVHFEIPSFADSGGRQNQFVQGLPFLHPLLPDEENSINVPNFATPCSLLIHGFCFFPWPLILLRVSKTPPMGLENPRIFLACVLSSPKLGSSLPTHRIMQEGQCP
ncbi:hypothetical protein NPIL_609551 [Nephila pilipes]|uniref:Uncharacterized protein n=1 Tax=Nephila pilipes TaxID=299642 RepID=A0A8X6UB10_NEPPI|nr:hypothetical protein NPIL_609551 [Nephila pilipes]